MVHVIQITPLPAPPGYAPPPDLAIQTAFDDAGRRTADWDQARVLITHSGVGMPMDLWDRMPKLGLISNFGVGLDRIDLTEARRRGIRVTFTPDQLSADVADLALAFVLALLRELRPAHAYVQSDDWAPRCFRLGRSLAGQRLGVIGLGRIGRALARRAEACEMVVGYHGRSSQDAPWTYFPSLLEMAAWADVLVAAVPGGPQTQGLVSREVLAALGPQGLFVNVARASVVDEQALIDALQRGAIAGAGLEVFDPASPLPAAIGGLDQVLLAPHIGSATVQTRKAMADSVFGNVKAFLEGRPLTDEVA